MKNTNRRNWKSNRYKSNGSKRPISNFDAFTGGKHPEFAVFYNIAFFRMAGLVNHLQGRSYAQSKDALEVVFEKWMNQMQSGNDTLGELQYSRLRNYLWKGYFENKNSSGYELTDSDVAMVQELLLKLREIRNFQSHVYHDNCVLKCSDNLMKFIEDKYVDAILAQQELMPKESTEFLDEFKKSGFDKNVHLFDTRGGRNMMTQEGRTFFLSFFLTRGEMARFLQQRKGSKRNDKPEFKIKHKVYRHFTHRDGASRNFYGFEQSIADSLPPEELRHTEAIRQAFKEITYLNDVPGLINDPELFPLFLKNGDVVSNATDLAQWCKEFEFFKVSGIEVDTITPKEKKEDKKKEQTVLEHFLKLSHPEMKHWTFELSQSTLHKLILDSIRNNDGGALLLDRMEMFVTEREHLLSLIENSNELNVEPEQFTLNEELDQYYRYKIRSGEFLKRKLGAWLQNIQSGKLNSNDTEELISKIKSEPIEFNYYDTWYAEERKPRRKNHFVLFAVKFLIDHNVTPEWEWCCESFEHQLETKTQSVYGEMKEVEHNVLVRKNEYASSIPNNCRLYLTPDDQVLVKHRSFPERKFLLGHRAMKNLIAIHFIFPDKDISEFLPRLNQDLSKILNAKVPFDWSSVDLLTSRDVRPGMLKNLSSNSTEPRWNEALAAKVKKRIKFVKKELKPFSKAAKNKSRRLEGIRMSRSNINRQIMQCYKFFDWKYPHSSAYKFLRQDEYQRLSVFHYCLHEIEGRFVNYERYGFLIKDSVKHMPEEVKELLKTSRSLDELLIKVSKKTIELLKQWKKSLAHNTDDDNLKIAKRIGVALPSKSMRENSHVPFDVHPTLPSRCFLGSSTHKENSISGKVRKDPTLTDGLIEGHYNYQPFIDWYKPVVGSWSDAQQKLFKKAMRRFIGKVDELNAQDALIWKMAKTYFDAFNPGHKDIVQEHLIRRSGGKLGVSGLRNLELPFSVELRDEEKSALGLAGLNVVVSIKMHQLDDYLLVESKPVVGQVVCHLLKRYPTPEQRDAINIELNNSGKVLKVPYDEVFKEIQRIQNNAMEWARAVFNWEQGIIKNSSRTEIESIATQKTAEGMLAYLSFSDVIKLNEVNGGVTEVLKRIRNTAFHAGIPKGWSYPEMEEYEELCQLIGFEKKQTFVSEQAE